MAFWVSDDQEAKSFGFVEFASVIRFQLSPQQSLALVFLKRLRSRFSFGKRAYDVI